MKIFFKSVGHALDGLKYLLKTQRNFRIHLVLAFIACVGALLLHFNMSEWGVLFVMIGLVFASEAFNTAIEKAVDCATQDHCEHAKAAKDVAAAAVVFMSVAALLVGIVLYGSKIYKLLFW